MNDLLADRAQWVSNQIYNIFSGLPLISVDQSDSINPSSISVRWVAITLAMVVFFYESAAPLLQRGNGAYFDIRFGIVVWLFFAALIHTPMASSEIEDHPSYVFLLVFVIVLLVTNVTLALFTTIHHFFAWLISFCSSDLSKALWVPSLRSIRSFRAILLASVGMSLVTSSVFSFCVSHTTSKKHESSSNQECTPSLFSYYVGMVVEDDTIVEFCNYILPLDDNHKPDFGLSSIGSKLTNLPRENIAKLSFFESPLGLLWFGGVVLWSLHYTVRRVNSVDKRILASRAAKRVPSKTNIATTTEKDSASANRDDEELSDDEYTDSVHVDRAPADFQPMSEWYSLTVTNTAFQLLVSMKLFLGRFDMRTMQVALHKGPEEEEEESESFNFKTGQTNWRALGGTHRSSHPSVNAQTEYTRYGTIDTRFASRNDLWFDWLADTGDGGNSTYAVARTVAQPSLTVANANEHVNIFGFVRDFRKSKVSDPQSLPRGDLLLIGGDLAYPTPSLAEYDSRLFVPFEYAMESPASYHRNDISMKREGYVTHQTLQSRLSFLDGQFQKSAIEMATAMRAGQSMIDISSKGTRDQMKVHQSRSGASGSGDSEFASASEKDDQSHAFHSSNFRIGSVDSLSSHFEPPGEQEGGSLSLEDSDEEENTDLPPIAYAIPGNHDWFDGLATFMQCICMRDWLGGWHLPQTKSYFSLKLPHGWWVLALDFALEDDIDGLQYQYFADIACNHMDPNDQVILVTHEPTWCLDAYLNQSSPEDKPISKSALNLKQLLRRHLRGKVAMRIAGDIHNYMRHDAVQPLSQSALRAGASPVLVVSGGGGAFLHPTHTFPSKFKETGAEYELNRNYPSKTQSRIVSMQNLGKGFRRQNWRFDFIGTTWYFLCVASFFPRCGLNDLMDVDSYAEFALLFGNEVLSVFMEIWTDTVLSLIVVVGTMIITYIFADSHHGRFYRVIVGLSHALTHFFCAISLFLILELSVDIAVRDKLAGQGYDKFFGMFQDFERRVMPSSWWTTGFSEKVMRFALRIFDMPENMATTRAAMCSNMNNIEPSIRLTRLDVGLYYLGNFLYLYILAADIVTIVLGLYLYICVNFFNLHWNEAFSSLRCEDFKSFMRFHIDSKGDLHAYAIGIDTVPKKWVQDERWKSSWSRLMESHLSGKSEIDELDPNISSHGAPFPSRWKPATTRNRLLRRSQEPKLVDYFCIPRRVHDKAPRRNASVIDESWWNAFDDIESKKKFTKNPMSFASFTPNSYLHSQARQGTARTGHR